MFDIDENGKLKRYIPDGQETSVSVPNGVSYIGSDAFCNCKDLTTVILPPSTTAIGCSAFRNCSSLTTVVLNEGLRSIGSSDFPAFEDCPLLNHLELPVSLVTYYCGDFHYKAGAPDIKSITVRNGVTKIPQWLFCELQQLENVYLPDSVKIINDRAFYHCERLTNIHMPAHLTEIGNEAFSGCKMLHGISIPDSVRKIGSLAFCYCPMLQDVSIPDSVQEIGEGCFFQSGIVNIKLPNGIKEIKKDTFRGCKELRSITIPESVQLIYERAFLESGLRSIRIPASVKIVGNDAFDKCSLLRDVTICSKDTRFTIDYAESAMFAPEIFKDAMGTKTIIKTRASLDIVGYGDLTLTDTALIWNKSALVSALAFGVMSRLTKDQLEIPLFHLVRDDIKTFSFPTGGLIIRHWGKEHKIAFLNRDDFKVVHEYLTAYMNARHRAQLRDEYLDL